jgi:sugar phosphate isomerase/epimerase
VDATDTPSGGLLGVSTSVLRDHDRFGELLDAAPDVVEWYALPRRLLPEIERFSDRYGIRNAVHAPMPVVAERWRFGPTSHDPAITEGTLAMALESIECAAALDALHVVIHFPDPEPPYLMEGFEDRARAFLEPVASAAERRRVRVVLENMTPNPLLRSPEQYRAVLDEYPTLGLCFDIGHAHLAEPEHSVDDYIDALGDRVVSVHLYNTTAARYAEFGHEPIAPGQAREDGFFDWADAVDAVLAAASPVSWVLEHDQRYCAATRTALAALREQVTRGRRVDVVE